MTDTLRHLVAETIHRPDSGKFLYILNQIDTTAREDNPEEVVQWHYNDPVRLQDAENLVLEDNVVVWVMNTAKVTEKVMEFKELMGNPA